jgi:hypothetical protein
MRSATSRLLNRMVPASSGRQHRIESAQVKRCRLSGRFEVSTTVVRHPSVLASSTSGTTSAPAPKMTSDTGGSITSISTSSLPESPRSYSRTLVLPAARASRASPRTACANAGPAVPPTISPPASTMSREPGQGSPGPSTRKTVTRTPGSERAMHASKKLICCHSPGVSAGSISTCTRPLHPVPVPQTMSPSDLVSYTPSSARPRAITRAARTHTSRSRHPPLREPMVRPSSPTTIRAPGRR